VAGTVPGDEGAGVTAASLVLAEVGVPTADRMRDLGQRLAGLLHPGDLVVLTGALGAGKTTLVQGIGLGLGIRGPVTSPTFVIARVHPPVRDRGGPSLVHADAYRLGSRAEVDDLDLDADLESSVTVVEWGEGLVEDLAESHLEIEITMVRPEATAALDRNGAAPHGEGEAPHGEGEAPHGEGEAPDEARTVRLVARGERWTAAGEPVRLALLGGAGST
jgi:tRNA threonylcarbamoyladenosine biosynthesis protein TsaE